MRKINIYTLIIVIISLLSSCKEKEAIIQITINPETTTNAPGDIVTFVFDLTPDFSNNGELGDFVVMKADSSIVVSENYSGQKTITDSIKYTVPADALEGDIIYLIFTATDSRSNKKSSNQAVITVSWNIPFIVIADDVQGFFDATDINSNMIFDLLETEVHVKDGNFNEGELAFVWQDEYKYSIVSPNATWISTLFDDNGIVYSTSDKQETKIMTYTEDWNSLTRGAIDSLSINSETIQGGGNGVQDLKEGDIIVFETQDGRKGALKIITNVKTTHYLTCDIRYQIK